MSRSTQSGLVLLIGIGAFDSIGCSVCREDLSRPECQPTAISVEFSEQRVSLLALQKGQPVSLRIPGLKSGAQARVRRLQLPDGTEIAAEATPHTQVSEQLDVIVPAAALQQLQRGGPLAVEVLVNDYWQGQTTKRCRLVVPPALTASVVVPYANPTQLSPIAVEITKLLGDTRPALFVTEMNGGSRQLSRYDLQGPVGAQGLQRNSGFNWLSGGASDTLFTLTQSGSVNVSLVYDQTNLLAAIPLPMGMRTPAPTSVPDASVRTVLGLRAIPGTDKYFMVGGETASGSVQSLVYNGMFVPGPAPIGASAVRCMATRSLAVPRAVDPDAGRAFDALVLDQTNRVSLVLRHGQTPSAAEQELANSVTAAIKDTLAGQNVAGLALADLDDDGLQDVLVATQAGALYMAAQNEDGSFIPAQMIASAPPNVRDLAVGDLDGDGLLDVVLAGADRLTVYRNSAKP